MEIEAFKEWPEGLDRAKRESSMPPSAYQFATNLFCFLQALHSSGQFGQARQPAVLLFEFFERPRGCTPIDVAAADRFAGRDARLRRHDRAVVDLALIADAHLAANDRS